MTNRKLPNNQIEWEYCRKCDDHVEGDYTSHACVGQYGMNVYIKAYCTVCGNFLYERLIDKDI